MIWVGEKQVVEPKCWIDQWYLDPALSLLPVEPPEVDTFSLPCTKDYLKPVGDKLIQRQSFVNLTKSNSKDMHTFLSEGTKGTYVLFCVCLYVWLEIGIYTCIQL